MFASWKFFCGFTVGRKPNDLEKVHLLHLVTPKYLTCRHQGSNLGHTWISDSLSEQVVCLGLNPQAKLPVSVSTIEYLQFNKSETALDSACFGIYLTTNDTQPLNVTHIYFLLVQNSLRMYLLTYFQSFTWYIKSWEFGRWDIGQKSLHAIEDEWAVLH